MPTPRNKLNREVFGLILIFAALFLLLSLITFDEGDPGFNQVVSKGREIKNGAGAVGAYLSGMLVDIFGVGAFAFPITLLVLGLKRFIRTLVVPWHRWFGFALCFFCAISMAASDWALANLAIGQIKGGGFFGRTFYNLARYSLSTTGGMILWSLVFITGAQLLAGLTWASFFKRIKGQLTDLATKYSERMSRRQKVSRRKAQNSPDQDEEQIVKPRKKRPAKKELEGIDPSDAEQVPEVVAPISRPSQDDRDEFDDERVFDEPAYLDEPDEAPVYDEPEYEDPVEPAPVHDQDDFPDLMEIEEPKEEVEPPVVKPLKPAAPPQEAPASQAAAPEATIEHTPPQEKLFEDAIPDPPKQPKPKRPKLKRGMKRGTPPATSLLAPIIKQENAANNEELQNRARALGECLEDFKIKGDVQHIRPGPVVTMFEYKPAPGIKVSKIAGLSDDIALALRALAVRIEAPIPGKDTVGVEVPNEERETVFYRDIVESNAFKKSDSIMPLALGKDISGRAQVVDLAKMPHLLIAGATGAGKSVCVNSILLSFLFKARPNDLKLLLIDPKRIELAVYADLPHLVHPVVTDMTLAKNALDWAVHEMDQRYEAMAKLGVRNIQGYNKKLKDMLSKVDHTVPPELAGLEPMPYLVLIIDELADLMLTAAKEVEISIVRLAQLARAAGIHMILATQRPSVDVVTGLIKANFPCRISFQVTSKHDSRTILDQVGAEHLLGKGDMLFKPGGGKVVRMHGAFVSDEDVGSVVDYWKAQQPPDYRLDFSESQADAESGGGGEGGGDALLNDPLYKEAVDFVSSQGKASISLLQRRFRIGFNRSARFIEQMEMDGIIGPAEGSKPRTVLIGQDK